MIVGGDDRNGSSGATTAVAIERDKSSQQAVKWAVDHLLISSHCITLVHVRNKAHITGFAMTEATPESSREQVEAESAQIFLPYRAFCARKGIQLIEVTLEDSDVSKALTDYIATYQILNIVVGASSRNAISKKFRNPDVPTNLVKSAPDFCAVYVISKGKAVTVRSAKGPAPSSSPTAKQPATTAPNLVPDHPDDSVKTPFIRGHWRGPIPPPILQDNRPSFDKNIAAHLKPLVLRPPSGTNKLLPSHMMQEDSSHRSQRPSVASRDSVDDMDFGGLSSDHSDSFERQSVSSDSTGYGSPTHFSKRDLEAEMRRLKLELKQTMDMYNSACKEAISAKQKAKELVQLKMEEDQKFKEARSAEEAALALAEVEKAKCKAALEAAEQAQKVAELEAKKRLYAEMKAKREAEEKMRALDALAHTDVRYRKYTIEEIELATEYFSENLKIGEGGYGPVYRASLDHTPVAIKVLRPDAQQGRKQFQREVEVLSCVRHPNMVLLLGACPEYGCLVYEYMDSGSLEDRLFRRGNTPSIPWSIRFKIAAEIATALLFLHQAKPEPLVHRDLKPANILLDHNYVSKISDVGLSRLVPASVANNVTQYRMTSAAGTFCYIDPEYQQTGMLGCKSDVYSLGVLLLQIITAKPPMQLAHIVDRAISNGSFEEMLDPTVSDWPVEECLAFAKLALKCAELRRKDRPELGTVILPELNRLRNLGHAYEEGHNIFSIRSEPSSFGDIGGGISSDGGHPRARSVGLIGLNAS